MSTAALSLVGAAWQALVVSLLIGLGAAGIHPSMNAVLATSVTAARRSNVFALEHAVGNAGFGAGAIIGGLAGDVSHPRSFVVLFVGAGLALGVWALLLVRMGGRARHSCARSRAGHEPCRYWR